MSTLTTHPETTSAQTTRVHFVTPRANFHHDTNGYTLEVELPGVSKEGVEITVDDGQLTILGHRNAAPAQTGVIHNERPAADFRRVFDLDPGIDTTNISAGIEQGLLTLTLHKAETAKPRKITVS
jgi:HSP20 family protein